MDGKTSAKSKIKAENCMENPPIHSVGSEWISMDLSFPSKRERDNFFSGRSQKCLIYNFLNNARRRLQWAEIAATERMQTRMSGIVLEDKSQLSEQTRTNKRINAAVKNFDECKRSTVAAAAVLLNEKCFCV